jgi:hypothetical protein
MYMQQGFEAEQNTNKAAPYTYTHSCTLSKLNVF